MNWQNSWLNQLKQIGLLGSQRAVLTLSQIAKARFEIEKTNAKLCGLKDIPSLLSQNGTSDLFLSVHIDLNGQIKGRSVLVFPWECAERLNRRLWSQTGVTPRFLSEMSYTAIKQLGSFITNSYMNGLEDWLNVALLPSVPDFSVGLADTILDSLIYEYGDREKFLVCLLTHFIEKELDINGSICIFLVSHSVQISLQDRRLDQPCSNSNNLIKKKYADSFV